MSISHFVTILARQKLLVSIAIAVGIALSLMIYLLTPASYTASATAYVAANSDSSTNAAYQGSLLSQQRVKSYTALVTQPRVLGEVIARLNLAETPEELARQVTASNAPDSVLITISADNPNPQVASQIANAVTDVFVSVVADIEQPVFRNAQPAVTVRLVQPAIAPSEPSSMGLLFLVALGLVGGLAIGSSIAVVRDARDSSIKSGDELKNVFSAPLLGEIPLSSSDGVTTAAGSSDPRALEAYRKVRTALQFVNIGRPSKVVAVTSAVPGEGKTTTAVSLANLISSTGASCVLVEADLRRPAIAGLLGLETDVGLTTVLTEKIRLDEAIQAVANGLAVLTAGQLPPNPSELLGSEPMARLIGSLAAKYEYVIVDTPPLLPVTDAAALARIIDAYLFVCRSNSTSSEAVKQSGEALATIEASVLGAVLTMSKAQARDYDHYGSYASRASGQAGRSPRPSNITDEATTSEISRSR